MPTPQLAEKKQLDALHDQQPEVAPEAEQATAHAETKKTEPNRHPGGNDALGKKENLLSSWYDEMVDVANLLAAEFKPLGLHFRPEILLATAMQEASSKDPLNARSFDNGLGLMQITPYQGKLDAGVAHAIGWDNSKSVEYNVQHSRWRDAKSNLLAGGYTLLGKAQAIKGALPKTWEQMDEQHRWRATMFAYNAGQGAAIAALKSGGADAPMISSYTYKGQRYSHDYTAELKSRMDYVESHDPFQGGGEQQHTPAKEPPQKLPGDEGPKHAGPIQDSVGKGGANKKADVIAVQTQLKARGFDPGPIDGDFGPNTLRAIIELQRGFLAHPDGLIEPGHATEKHLFFEAPKTEHKPDKAPEPDKTPPKEDPSPSHPIQKSVGVGGVNQKEDVIAVQKRLHARGLDPGPVDGDCGDRTIAAIRAFQSTFMAHTDGLIEPGHGTEHHLFQENGKVEVKTPPKANGQRSDTVANDGSLPHVNHGVKLTEAIESNYRVLAPYLPGGTYLTSGLRTDQDQANVIHNYFAQYGGPSSITDTEQQRQWLERNHGMVIAHVGSSPHRTGLAFDLSGASLSQIEAAVRRCAREKPAEFHFSRLIYESSNNCIHVEVTG